MENKRVYTAPKAEIETLVSEDTVLISVIDRTENLDESTEKFSW